MTANTIPNSRIEGLETQIQRGCHVSPDGFPNQPACYRSSSFPESDRPLARPRLQTSTTNAEMNDLQLANLLTMECARLDAARRTALRLQDGISAQPPAISRPKLFFWSAQRTLPTGFSTCPSASPPERQNTAWLNVATKDPDTSYRSLTPVVRGDFTDRHLSKTENGNGKRSRPEDHEIGYVKPPKSKRRPNGWWTLAEYAHLPKPTYARAQHEKSSNIRGITRVQGTAIQNSGITSITHPDRVESSCDNGIYGGVWPNVTVPPLIHPHVPPILTPDGTFRNVPAWDAPGDVSKYLPPPGEIHTGFDPKWDVRVPAYMTMEAVLGVATDAEVGGLADVLDVAGGKRKLGGRRKGKHAAARELAQQQLTVGKVAAIKLYNNIITKAPNTRKQRSEADATGTTDVKDGVRNVNATQGCPKERHADRTAAREVLQRECGIDTLQVEARRQLRER